MEHLDNQHLDYPARKEALLVEYLKDEEYARKIRYALEHARSTLRRE